MVRFRDRYDAVVIGAGPNGLVAGNVLADAGWDVVVVEAADDPGGAVRTAEVTAPGFRNDLFSAFYPLAAASPVLARLRLEDHGLRWVHAPHVVAHPTPGGPTAILSRDLATTAASLDAFAPGAGAGEAWAELHELWRRVGPALVDTLLGPVPPVRPLARLATRLGPRRWLDFARFALLPVRRLAEERHLGPGGALLLAGNALHSDVGPETPPSGFLGWLLASLGQDIGFPVPEGGAGRLTDALVARLRAAGGTLVTGCPVERVIVEGGRARGVALPGGTFVGARRGVIAAGDAEALFHRLVGPDHLPARFLERLARFQRSDGTVKVDWALRAPIPWQDPEVGRAGTVHLADSLDELTLTAARLATGAVPDRPFIILGQMTTSDPTRSPAGTESAWAYTHIPQAAGDDPAVVAAVAERVEDRIEAHAPGVRDLVAARHVAGPADLERLDPALVGGDIGGGTQQLHQQLVFRPVTGLARPETPIAGLYLGSASAHPGGGVHGACGNNAARAALAHDRWRPGRAGRRR